MRDVVLIVDVLDDFAHPDGDALLASFAERQEQLVALLDSARAHGVHIVYANDNKGVWDGDARRLVEVAVEGPGGELIRDVVPQDGERFVVKPRYSAFDHTPLELILRELECERLVIAGMTTEGCVTQSAIDARELELKVTVVAGACATIDERVERTALRYLVDVAGVVLDDASLFTCDELADRPGRRTSTSRAPPFATSWTSRASSSTTRRSSLATSSRTDRVGARARLPRDVAHGRVGGRLVHDLLAGPRRRRSSRRATRSPRRSRDGRDDRAAAV